MISIDRAKKIIECYGGYPLAWPAHEQQAMQQLLLNSKSLKTLQNEALAFDSFIGASEKKNEASMDGVLDQLCASKILTNLPEQERTINQVPVTLISGDIPLLVSKSIIKKAHPVALVASVVLIVVSLFNIYQFNKTSLEFSPLSLSEYMTLYVDDEAEVMAIENNEQLEILAFLEPQIMDDY